MSTKKAKKQSTALRAAGVASFVSRSNLNTEDVHHKSKDDRGLLESALGSGGISCNTLSVIDGSGWRGQKSEFRYWGLPHRA